MHGRARHPTATTALRRASGAITWIDHGQAIVARTVPTGLIDVATVDRGEGIVEGTTFLARVAHEIGDRDRVVILGPDDMRTELEREYVAIDHRPERIVDVEPSGPVTLEELVDRLHELAK